MIDYKVCRWCKWFNNGMCTNERNFGFADFDFHPFYEDGVLSEAINEGFGSVKFKELEMTLFESSLSKKKQAEIMKVLYEEFEDLKVNFVEQIDDSVSKALENFDFGEQKGIPIVDPSEFSCKNFW